MSKTKTTVTFTSIFTKILLAIAIVAVITVLVVVIVRNSKKSKLDYYECVKYEITYAVGTNPQPDNRLESYEYYRLYLNDDKTFTIKYVLKEDDAEKIESGTYVKNNDEYTLTYKGTPVQDYSSVIHLTIKNGNLVRNEKTKTNTNIDCDIVQEFSNKK